MYDNAGHYILYCDSPIDADQNMTRTYYFGEELRILEFMEENKHFYDFTLYRVVEISPEDIKPKGVVLL